MLRMTKSRLKPAAGMAWVRHAKPCSPDVMQSMTYGDMIYGDMIYGDMISAK